MHHFLKAGLAIVLIVVCTAVQAQLNAIFAPFDCREQAEFFEEEPVFEPVIIDSFSVAEAEPEHTIFVDTVDGWKQWSYLENYSFGKDRGSLPMINDLQALHPYFRDRVLKLISQCKRKGIELAIVETYRTHAKQDEYKGMGRKYTTTGAGKSKHQYGLAVDVVPIVNKVAVWDNLILWKKIGAVGEKLGLRWGGRWRKPFDPGHFEWTGGITAYSLEEGNLPAIPYAHIHYPCLQEDIKLLRKYWKEWETAQGSMTRK